ncbi:von Willebrand factor A domain-containing protein 9 [Trichoplax sp. H2]|uniref:Integrator complex subunit 14 n=1 Tax=Trichoplax adhaerens TaxID=10228 RepID=B3RSF2_TRIAD|nr:hypothetical protein TRIADDRAFT_54576 [Trichoplax adhaerens]EDV26504.1 hypothetical protein TRIADDRAFT_54576 [Trichoplax adhaerens]RDD46351.1 von Willebrand factor A domain-containing protein 9 [Trichoplax sp. H2]|eukprot:XP_002110500.1 hypothetical protein TRIADDRAFT_54576 [Trichoplax adhaerens]
MPTLVLLDVSLSMCRPATNEHIDTEGNDNEISRRQLAHQGLRAFFDYLANNFRLEFTSLVVFSSLWEEIVPFTRDYELLKSKLSKAETYDKTCFASAFEAARSVISDGWGPSTPFHVILVTDGLPGVGDGSLRQFLDSQEVITLPFTSKLHIICISPLEEVGSNLHWYKQLCDTTSSHGGHVYFPEKPLTQQSVEKAFMQLAENNYMPYKGILQFGNLRSNVNLVPPPINIMGYNSTDDYDFPPFPYELKICGFLDSVDVGQPPCIARHLVLPYSSPHNLDEAGAHDASGSDSSFDDAVVDDSHTPSFCVLLHGSLKVEKMVALVKLSDDWFGILQSWADSKKKSNLVLSIFEPAIKLSWLGELTQLGPSIDEDVNPYVTVNEDEEESPFPVPLAGYFSYHHQGFLIWTKNSLQSDIQKTLRYARRLPDKKQAFYKEVNKLRRNALVYSFDGVIACIASLLLKEAENATSQQAVTLLKHVAAHLRSENVYSTIEPVPV